MSELRTKRQEEFATKWINNGKFGILNLAPRFGKCRTTINILNKLKPKEILIAYPDNKIRDSWISEFDEMNYNAENVTYTTHLSLHKHQDVEFDLVVIDEIHLLSEAQIEAAKLLLSNNKFVLGLTGTLSRWTEETLAQELDMLVVAEYPISLAVEEGVVVDYEIIVHTTSLDNQTINDYKGKKRTEKKQFDAYTWTITMLERSRQNSMFLRLARMRIVQNSLAKQTLTKNLLQKYKDERVLVFCGVTKTSDALGIPSYHSKSTEKNVFDSFVKGETNHLAVVKIGNSGVTYKSLNRLIINYFDSNAENLAQKINRCMGFEYNNPDKKAYIHIISTNESVELKWLNKALEFFDPNKIKYV
jgi:superfamily II DNA or RNA helicase